MQTEINAAGPGAQSPHLSLPLPKFSWASCKAGAGSELGSRKWRRPLNPLPRLEASGRGVPGKVSQGQTFIFPCRRKLTRRGATRKFSLPHLPFTQHSRNVIEQEFTLILSHLGPWLKIQMQPSLGDSVSRDVGWGQDSAL